MAKACDKCGGTEFKVFGGGTMTTDCGIEYSLSKKIICAKCGKEIKSTDLNLCEELAITFHNSFH